MGTAWKLKSVTVPNFYPIRAQPVLPAGASIFVVIVGGAGECFENEGHGHAVLFQLALAQVDQKLPGSLRGDLAGLLAIVDDGRYHFRGFLALFVSGNTDRHHATLFREEAPAADTRLLQVGVGPGHDFQWRHDLVLIRAVGQGVIEAEEHQVDLLVGAENLGFPGFEIAHLHGCHRQIGAPILVVPDPSGDDEPGGRAVAGSFLGS